MNLLDLIEKGGLCISQAKDYKELYKEMDQQLQSLNYVEDNFLEALLQREKEYPTGIEGNDINLALPHVDAIYTKQNALFIYQLKKEIPFVRMDDHQKEVEVRLVFLLLIRDLEFHVKAISELTKVWTNSDIMEGLLFVKTKEELIQLLKTKLYKQCENVAEKEEQ